MCCCAKPNVNGEPGYSLDTLFSGAAFYGALAALAVVLRLAGIL